MLFPARGPQGRHFRDGENPRSLSTPEQKCIGWPERKYISNASKKARALVAFLLESKPGWDYPPAYPSWRSVGAVLALIEPVTVPVHLRDMDVLFFV